MSPRRDAAGRRFVSVEVEVPGEAAAAWRAIATGPGISAWFVPTSFEFDAAGRPTRVVSNFGPGMESVAVVAAWEPPHRFTADSPDLGPDAPVVETEWSVETLPAGGCRVRVEHALVTDKTDWDAALTAWEQGWPDFFRILRCRLAHFPDLPSTAFQAVGMTDRPAAETWDTLCRLLGLTDAKLGERRTAPAGSPPLAGHVEVEPSAESPALLRLDEPCPGLAHVFVLPMVPQVCTALRFYFYGPTAVELAARDEPLWIAWRARHFPAPAEPA